MSTTTQPPKPPAAAAPLKPKPKAAMSAETKADGKSDADSDVDRIVVSDDDNSDGFTSVTKVAAGKPKSKADAPKEKKAKPGKTLTELLRMSEFKHTIPKGMMDDLKEASKRAKGALFPDCGRGISGFYESLKLKHAGAGPKRLVDQLCARGAEFAMRSILYPDRNAGNVSEHYYYCQLTRQIDRVAAEVAAGTLELDTAAEAILHLREEAAQVAADFKAQNGRDLYDEPRFTGDYDPLESMPTPSSSSSDEQSGATKKRRANGTSGSDGPAKKKRKAKKGSDDEEDDDEDEDDENEADNPLADYGDYSTDEDDDDEDDEDYGGESESEEEESSSESDADSDEDFDGDDDSKSSKKKKKHKHKKKKHDKESSKTAARIVPNPNSKTTVEQKQATLRQYEATLDQLIANGAPSNTIVIMSERISSLNAAIKVQKAKEAAEKLAEAKASAAEEDPVIFCMTCGTDSAEACPHLAAAQPPVDEASAADDAPIVHADGVEGDPIEFTQPDR